MACKGNVLSMLFRTLQKLEQRDLLHREILDRWLLSHSKCVQEYNFRPKVQRFINKKREMTCNRAKFDRTSDRENTFQRQNALCAYLPKCHTTKIK